MARKPVATDAQVENYLHEAARRVNIPTAENQALVPDDDKVVKTLRYPRNPDLDPQLVWRGKDAEDSAPLEVAAPPIYIQEKIHPRALIENLRRQSVARKSENAPQIDFFHDFNGLDPDARTEFYEHDQNWQNRMILGDSLLVMGSLAEREALRGKVQCIYFDPPYGIKFNSNWQPSINKDRYKKDDREENVSREPEVVRAFRDTWKDGIHSYLSYLRDRFVAARDLLHPSGSIFVQIGDRNVHVVRALLDEIFGPQNFIAQIAYSTTTGRAEELLSSDFDFILFYAKDKNLVKYRAIWDEKPVDEVKSYKYKVDNLREHAVAVSRAEKGEPSLVDPEFEIAQLSFAVSQDPGKPDERLYFFKGRNYDCGAARHWKTKNPEGLDRLAKAGRLIGLASQLNYVRLHRDFPYRQINNVWIDTGSAGYSNADPKRYVVQTDTAVIERCILMATDPGDLVLDPTCGSGTTAYVSENRGRRWITIDTSRVALTLARARLMGAKYDYYLLKDSKDGAAKESEITGKPPIEGTFQNDLRHGFVYERAPHVMLKNIAKNAEIDLIYDRYQAKIEPLRAKLNEAMKKDFEDWQIPRDTDTKWPVAAREAHAEWWKLRQKRQKEIDASIARNADVEYLYDRPYKAKGVVRVAGPFTVESLSPHRVLPLGEDPFLAEMLEDDGDEATRDATTVDAATTDFAAVVYESLKASGVQNTRKGEAIQFEWLKPRVSRSGSSGGSDLKNDVAAWFIDDDYDEESFFVRQAYFVGQDPYDALKRALKAEIDETAWSELNSTISRPFPKPASGRICVKVINHFGDEVQKVFEV